MFPVSQDGFFYANSCKTASLIPSTQSKMIIPHRNIFVQT